MKKLLSLPPNLVEPFHDITGRSRDEYYCTCDPIGHRLGSGGGTAWLLQQAFLEEKGAESSTAKLRRTRQSTHAYTRIPLGTRTTL